jgi:putative membrane protein
MSERISNDPPLPAAHAVGPVERLHPAFLIAGLSGSVRAVSGGYAFLAYLIVSGRFSTALIVGIGIFIVSIISVFVYWRHFEFRVDASEIRIDSGIFSRTHRSIPFDRIQDVDISQGVLARLFGIAKVKLETGGSSGPKADEGVLQAIPLKRAEDLRNLIRSRRGAAAATAETASGVSDTPTAEPIYRMGIKRLLLAGSFNFSLALFAGLFGLTQTMGDFMGFDPLSAAFWQSVLSEDPARSFILAHQAAAVIAGIILLVLIGLVTGVVRTVVRDWGFRLDRTEVGLRRRRGLTTITDVTLAVRRVQAAIMAGGPLRQALGYSELRVQTLGHDEGSGNHVVAPLATCGETNAIVEQLGWRRLPHGIPWTRVSSGYIWSLMVGLTPLYLVLIVQLAVIQYALFQVQENIRAIVWAEMTPVLVSFFAVLGVIVVAIGSRALAWRTTAYAIDGDRLLVRTGWWKKRLTLLPLRRIQSITLYESFVTRRFGIASLAFGVAGGRAGRGYSVPAIPREGARGLRDRLLDVTP